MRGRAPNPYNPARGFVSITFDWGIRAGTPAIKTQVGFVSFFLVNTCPKLLNANKRVLTHLKLKNI